MRLPDLGERLAAAGRGDLGPFGACYNATAPVVFVLVCGLCGQARSADAEQVTKRVSVRLWLQAPRFDARNRCAATVPRTEVRSEAVAAGLRLLAA